jgi:glycolate oxidase iron-sulfur subunit
MHTNTHPKMVGLPNIKEAEDILSACVHCGFCTATCPTYQHFGDERDGPRGRIYLIKQLLETNEVTASTQTHLDRCLTCRSCETTCPSGVKYGRLVDIGRGIVEERVTRKPMDRFMRFSLRKVLPNAKLFGALVGMGQLVKPLLKGTSIGAKIPPKKVASPWPKIANNGKGHARHMLALAGCAQSVTTPNTNAATARVLDKLGISLVEAPKAGCCGAVDHHLGAHADGLVAMRRNIDAWWPAIEAGAEAIVMTASGCGVMVKEYGELLEHDSDYAAKSKKISELTKDLSEILLNEDLEKLDVRDKKPTAFHCPCTLQHGQQLNGVVEEILTRAGVPLTKTKEKHLCCGSAGTYSVLQSKTSQQLLDNKLTALMVDNPVQIVTANVGCQMHLESKARVPVKHWIELLD